MNRDNCFVIGYLGTIVLIDVGWSDINIIEIRGAVIASWGTPARILEKVDKHKW